MSTLVLDTDTTELEYEQTQQLDGFEYLFRFLWADRESRWYISIYDQDGVPLALSIGLVVFWPLLRRFQDPRLPPGMLWCFDTSGSGLDMASPDELGKRVQLVYTTVDDPLLDKLKNGFLFGTPIT